MTDPRTQVQTMADVAYSQGLVPPALHRVIEEEQMAVVSLIDAGRWGDAHRKREASAREKSGHNS